MSCKQPVGAGHFEALVVQMLSAFEISNSKKHVWIRQIIRYAALGRLKSSVGVRAPQSLSALGFTAITPRDNIQSDV